MTMKLLNHIQKNLKAPKGQTNKFGNYKYRSCEDILEAITPLLGDGYVTLSDKVVMVGDRYYVKSTVTLVDGDEKVSCTAYAREGEDRKGMDDAQLTGATSSYSRKYACNGLFKIDDTKDADTMDAPQRQPKTQTKQPERSNQDPGGPPSIPKGATSPIPAPASDRDLGDLRKKIYFFGAKEVQDSFRYDFLARHLFQDNGRQLY